MVKKTYVKITETSNTNILESLRKVNNEKVKENLKKSVEQTTRAKLSKLSKIRFDF